MEQFLKIKTILGGLAFGGHAKLGALHIYLDGGLDSSCPGYMLHHCLVEVRGTGVSLVEFHLNAPRHNSPESSNLGIKFSIM